MTVSLTDLILVIMSFTLRLTFFKHLYACMFACGFVGFPAAFQYFCPSLYITGSSIFLVCGTTSFDKHLKINILTPSAKCTGYKYKQVFYLTVQTEKANSKLMTQAICSVYNVSDRLVKLFSCNASYDHD